MGSGPSVSAPTWDAKTPTTQPPNLSSNPQIQYQGTFGQPHNNFAGGGKGPQVPPPQMQQPQMQQPVQPPPQQQSMGQPWMSNEALMGYNNIGGESPMIDQFNAMRGMRQNNPERYSDIMQRDFNRRIYG